MKNNSLNRLLFTNINIYGHEQNWNSGWLLTEGKTIFAFGSGHAPDFPPNFVTRVIDGRGMNLLPGFIDLHTHGAMGHEAMDASPDGLREMAKFYAQHGVTSFLPTTWTASRTAILKVLETVGKMAGPVKDGAAILGVHLEGPYLNKTKCGAQDANLIRLAEPAEALEFLDSGLVRLIAIAPEFPENLWLVDECVRRGITVSAGHTNATYEQMKIAVQHGVRQVTHCYNAMQALSHREPGTVGAAMSFSEIKTELICDNIHIHPAAQKILVDVKQPRGVILITDAIRGAGLPPGDYPIDNRTITIRDGAAYLPGGVLAGSILTLDRALYNIQQNTGRSLQELWPMVSLNAARAIGVAQRKGSLEVGKDADLALIDSTCRVQMTIAEGVIVWDRFRPD
jgi:N-acetylglucosamine-6-phosphate deacetylase